MNRRILLGAFVGALLAGSAFLALHASPTKTTLPREPSPTPRIVSLAPAVSETLAALGAEREVVAVSDYCLDYRNLPRIGSAITPNYEAIARARPTLIVSSAVAGAQLEPLERLAPTRSLPWLTVAEVGQGIRELGRLTERNARADELAIRFEKELSRKPAPDAPRVLLLLDDASEPATFWYIKSNSLHGALLEAAGAKNAIPEPSSGAPRLAVEQLLAIDPDVIIVLGSQAEAAEPALFVNLRKLTPLAAVKRGRLGRLAGERLLGSGPLLLDFVAPLRKEITRLLGDDG